MVFEASVRRRLLKAHTSSIMEWKNKAAVLVSTIHKAANLVNGSGDEADDMIDDLKAVLIGDNYTSGRGKGTYFVGNVNGAEGFKTKYRDPFNQVQHAMAGIALGHEGMLAAQLVVIWNEEQPHDKLLYEATFPLGRKLDDQNFMELAQKTCSAICADPTSCNLIFGPQYNFGPNGVFPLSS